MSKPTFTEFFEGLEANGTAINFWTSHYAVPWHRRHDEPCTWDHDDIQTLASELFDDLNDKEHDDE